MLRGRYFFIIFLLAIYLVFTFPFWTGDLFKNVGDFPYRQINIPKEYYQLSEFLNKDQLDSVVFPVPITKIGMGSFWWNGGKDGYASMYPFIYMLHSKRIFYIDYESVNDDNLKKILTDRKYLKFLGFQNVSALVFHNDTNWGTVAGSTYWYPNTKEIFDELQGKIKNASPGKVINFGSLTLVDVIDDNFLPHIYTTNKVVTNKGSIKDLPDIVAKEDFDNRTVIFFENQSLDLSSLRSIDNTKHNSILTEFKKIDPTRYKIIIHQAQKPFILVFNEQFHPDWRLSLTSYAKNSATSGSGFISKNYQNSIQNDNLASDNLFQFLFGTSEIKSIKHIEANGYMNSWIVDPDIICHRTSPDKCILNSDGTYDLSLTLEFWPQRLFYLGAAISLSALAFCLIYLFRPVRIIKTMLKSIHP